jgi:hypothetical protein
MATKSERLTVLSEAEQFALYGLPDFDDGQRRQFFSFTEEERSLVFNRQGIHAQVHCALQLGYFKAKHAFFGFSWEETEEDRIFLVRRYFNDQVLAPQTITKYEQYTQRSIIAALFGYRLWSTEFLPQLAHRAALAVRRDVTPGFLVVELTTYLHEQKIVRPGHTTVQTLVSEALSAERQRLATLLNELLDESAKHALGQLLVREDTLSGLAVLKQDAKHFGYRQMILERQKLPLWIPYIGSPKLFCPSSRYPNKT